MAKKSTRKVTNEVIYNKIMSDFTSDRKYINDRGLPKMWADAEDMYNNEWWKDSDRPDHLTSATHNAVFEAVETMLPVVTARPPSPSVKFNPSEKALQKHLDALESDSESAEQHWKDLKDSMFRYASGLKRELVQVWNTTKMHQNIKMQFREYEIKGTDVVKSIWNSKKKRIEVEIIDIRQVVPNKHAKSIEACADTHFSHAFYMQASEVAEEYNIPLDKIKADGELDSDGNFQLYSDTTNKAGAVSGAVSAITTALSPNKNLKKGDALTLVIDYYCVGKVQPDEEDFEDYSIDMYDGEGKRVRDADGKIETKFAQRPKWKNGRIVTVCRGYAGHILRDEARSYKRIPFFRSANYERAGDFWGTSEARNIEMQNRMMNMIVSNIADNARLTGNPQKEVVIGSEIEEVTSEPGARYNTTMPNGVRNINPPPMPAYISKFLEWLQGNSIDRTTGITDAFRGIANAGDSGVKVQSLIDQGVGRIQPKTLDFTTLSRDLFLHWTDIIQNFYPEKLVQKLDDKSGEAKFDVFRPREVPDAVYDVDVSLTAMLPVDNQAQFDEALVLIEAGMKTFQFPLMSPEQLIELAPNIEDKQRAKDYVAWIQKQIAQEGENQENQDPANASTEQLRELGMPDDQIEALMNAKEAGDEEAIRALLAPYVGEQPAQE